MAKENTVQLYGRVIQEPVRRMAAAWSPKMGHIMRFEQECTFD